MGSCGAGQLRSFGRSSSDRLRMTTACWCGLSGRRTLQDDSAFYAVRSERERCASEEKTRKGARLPSFVRASRRRPLHILGGIYTGVVRHPGKRETQEAQPKWLCHYGARGAAPVIFQEVVHSI